MKKIIISALIFVFFLYGNYARAMCGVAKKDNSSYCEANIAGACCVIESHVDGYTCYEVWCYAYDQCNWYQDTPALCI